MKVGIITYHFPYNCGASLQCLALQTKLEELGHEVCIINYRPWYHQNRYTPLKNPVSYAIRRWNDPAGNIIKRIYHAVDGFLRVVHSWRKYPEVSKKDQKFRSFLDKYLKETRVYRTLKQLQQDPPDCDIYISGSDQLWNSGLTDGKFDGAYFLQFGDENVGRMTYSVGTNFSNLENPEEVLKELIKDLDTISLRETLYQPTVEAAAEGKIPTHIDLDPTMLLKPEQYTKFMADLPKEPEPYILTYTMTGKAQKKTYQSAQYLSEMLGMKVIDVCGDPVKLNLEMEDNRICGPDEFLRYIQNAEYVVTNSFHGTVFSVLLRKKFITVPHAQTGNRVTELLDKLGLSDRYYTIPTEIQISSDTTVSDGPEGTTITTVSSVANNKNITTVTSTTTVTDGVSKTDVSSEIISISEAIAKKITNDIDYDAVHEKLDALRKESVRFLQESVTKYGRSGGNA